MKKLYLLLITALAFTSTANAQREIDVYMTSYYEIASAGQTQPSAGTQPLVDGTHLLFDGNGQYKVFLSWDVMNMGATVNDTVAITDTIHIKCPVITIAGTGIGITQHGTSGQIWPATAPFALIPNIDPGGLWADTISKDIAVLDWCDSVWITSPSSDPNPVNETGRMADNYNCHSVTLTGWMTSVNDVRIAGNGLIVYPNPTTTGNMTAMFDFGHNNTGVITVTDVRGKTVYIQQLSNLKGIQKINLKLDGLANGLYSFRLAAGNKIAVERIYINN